MELPQQNNNFESSAPIQNKKESNLVLRLLAGIGLPLLFITGATILYKYGNPFPCLFYEFFHLYCPGCGSGRASAALLHLNILEALDYNGLYVIVLPFIGYYILVQYLRFVFRFKKLPRLNITQGVMLFVVIAVFAFWIARNLPFLPFCLLAP